jgi:hypothetical protein
MNDQQIGYAGFIRMVIDALEAAGVEYLVGGAVAVWVWGEPRATQDLDLVVKIPLDAVNALSKELEKRGMLVPPEMITEIIAEDRADLAINAIHGHSGYKAELFPVREDDELRKKAFARRRKLDFGPELGKIYVHTPEDLIVYKLIYFSLSQQTKHLRDIGSILLSMGDEVDISYIEDWAKQKGLIALWEEIYAQVQKKK